MSDEQFVMPNSATFTLRHPRYVCVKHGAVGDHGIVSTIPGHEMRLCLRCYLEKLKEIGVCELKEEWR